MADNASLDFDFNELPEIGNGWLDKLGRIREADPVFWSDKQGGWLITRHADVIEGYGGRLPLSTARLSVTQLSGIPLSEHAEKIPLLSSSTPNWIVNVDPPSHTRQRKLMGKAFSRKVVESMRDYVRGNIGGLLDDLERKGEAECNEDVARQITARTILTLLGVPLEHLPRLKEWAAAIPEALAVVNAPEANLLRAERAMKDMFDLFSAEIEKRRTDPKNDVFTGLVRAVDGGDSLTVEEMVGSSVVLLLAGHDTTLNSIVLGVEALSRHPAQREWLRANPDKADQAIVELMRYFAMSGGQTRLATEDFEWHGKQIKKGDVVFLMIAGANRDPRVFDRPEELDLSREDALSATFAPGVHHCIGHLLAKMQLTEFFTRAYDRFDNIQVIEPEVTFSPIWVFRSVPQLRVRFLPRQLAKAA